MFLTLKFEIKHRIIPSNTPVMRMLLNVIQNSSVCVAMLASTNSWRETRVVLNQPRQPTSFNRHRKNHTSSERTHIWRTRSRRWHNDDWEQSLFVDPTTPDRNEVIVTVFGKDGVISTIPPNYVSPSSLEDSGLRLEKSLPTAEDQGLCLGSVFSITATNGFDVSRRMNVSGFCQSLDYLAESIHMAIRTRGGEISHVKRKVCHESLSESISMSLCIPLLWGVPPEFDRVTRGIEKGGGIIHKVYKEWFIIP